MPTTNRKANRLHNYDYSQNGAYFITICTHQRQNVLAKIVGCDAYITPAVALSSYGKIVEKYINNINHLYTDISVDNYVIMPNHVHLIISISTGLMWTSTPTKTISDIIRSFKILVSKECGNSLWQHSFYDHIIRNEAEYQKVWEYIDINPLKWELDKYYN